MEGREKDTNQKDTCMQNSVKGVKWFLSLLNSAVYCLCVSSFVNMTGADVYDTRISSPVKGARDEKGELS